MSDDDETTLETKGLDKLIEMMGKKAPQVRVGILGTKSARSGQKAEKGGEAVDASTGKFRDQNPKTPKDGALNNATIGAFHEFGLGKNPQRSFLRIPIAEHLAKRLEASGAFDKDTFKEALAQGTFVPYMQKVAVVAEGIVTDAFDTGGDGKWPPSNMNGKTNKQTLVETQQLRNSITSEVK